MKKASELLEESAAPFDEACMMVRELEKNYNELLMAVERKFIGESRHETALRYIKQSEERYRCRVENGNEDI